MIKSVRKYFIVLSSYALLSLAVNAQRLKQIKIGDAAPSLAIQEWIKGEPVKTFQQGQAYVVEFSGTWCSPCRKAIPHLSELSKKYSPAIRIVSVYNENNDKQKPEALDYIKNVKTLVNLMGDKMDYSVAVDVHQQR